uniref:Pre-B-cell leukemia transcription factor-interacting protein 1 n=1 Tax=Pogona vitticeps TaxID=103695 RepID=A0A6J0U484_9SAUR
MADHSDSRESENNSWVIAGSEALPVEDLGVGPSEGPQGEDEPLKESTQAFLGEPECRVETPDPEETKSKGPGVELDVPTEQTPSPAEAPEPPSKEPHGQDGEQQAVPAPQGPIVIQKLGPEGEHTATSSHGEDVASVEERDVEGLRRRKGRDVAPAGPGATRNREDGTFGGEDGERTKWIFGLLVLMGLGLLVAVGVILDTDDEVPADISSPWPKAEGDELYPATDGRHWPAPPPPEPSGDAGPQQAKEDAQLPTDAAKGPQSLDAMGLLLDKLAKENQDIRLMQAALQAQKEELQALLRKTEGEAMEFTSQQQVLAAENARLVEALRRETASLTAAQAELRRLQDKLKHPRDTGTDAEPPPDRPWPKPESQDAEIRRLCAVLASVGQDVARASQKVPLGEGAEGLRAELSGVGQRLAQAVEGEEEGPKPSWRDGTKRKKEKAWLQRSGSPEGYRHDPLERHKMHKRMSEEPQRPKKHHGERETKPGKDWEPPRGVRKVKKPTEPSTLWETLAKHPYRAPQGCVGVVECAQREGLAPVEKAAFLRLVQSYLAELGWAEHYGGLAEALSGFFGSDGAFAHDRVSFVDFLDEVEDALEELARSLGRSREDPDDFEEVILKQVGARFPHRDGSRQHAKELKSEGFGPKNGRANRVRG